MKKTKKILSLLLSILIITSVFTGIDFSALAHIKSGKIGPNVYYTFDDTTGALDTASGNQIMDIFKELSDKGMTIIMITHEQSIADCAKKIFHIRDGQLYKNGEELKNIHEQKEI